MSQVIDELPPLATEEIISRIKRQQEETRKFVAEQHKLMAEREKLAAEANKLGRDYRFAPLLLLVAALGSVAATVVATIALIRQTSTP